MAPFEIERGRHDVEGGGGPALAEAVSLSGQNSMEPSSPTSSYASSSQQLIPPDASVSVKKQGEPLNLMPF